MEINSASTAYVQTQNLSSTAQISVQSQPSQTNDVQDKQLSAVDSVNFSGKGLMLSRLFGDTSANPPVLTQLTSTTMGVSSVNFLTNDDRDMLSELYAQAQQQGTDLQYVDDLAHDLGDYRMFGNMEGNVNNGGMYDMSGHAQTLRFTDTDATTATGILTGDGIANTAVDSGFLRYELDPGFSFGHRANFGFLQEVVNKFGQGAVDAGQSFDNKFSAYATQGNNNFIVETSSEVVLPTEEPDFRSVDGVFSITQSGSKNGFQMLNGKVIQLFGAKIPHFLNAEQPDKMSLLLTDAALVNNR
ncbi:hypothetical protein SJI19_06750 [Acerihabitans sp. TG2]|uniref:hypothetical protein n=1 Tax=Acerihabitans sp. TG2 TaxID=3096008 RepID=UPI002B223DAC|nr:hypothetical protein [Acerihabitans sp. TG2]MEA9390251.1 hypothetical protein [Acerihabitans sp. TG2]